MSAKMIDGDWAVAPEVFKRHCLALETALETKAATADFSWKPCVILRFTTSSSALCQNLRKWN